MAGELDGTFMLSEWLPAVMEPQEVVSQKAGHGATRGRGKASLPYPPDILVRVTLPGWRLWLLELSGQFLV